jgi:hypothetical protein
MIDYDFAPTLRTSRSARGASAHARTKELYEQLTDVPRAREALRVLVDDGLATRLGDQVGCSRAAVRVEAIAPVS